VEETQRTILLNGIRAGYGLSRSASLIAMDTKELSELVQKDEGLMKSCKDAITLGMADLLVSRNKFMEDHNMQAVDGIDEKERRFVKQINFWES